MNSAFWFLYSTVLKSIDPIKPGDAINGNAMKLEKLYSAMKWQIKCASFFARFSKRVWVNLGVGGSTLNDWAEFVLTPEFQLLYDRMYSNGIAGFLFGDSNVHGWAEYKTMKHVKSGRDIYGLRQVMNLGGNNALQNKMTGYKQAMKAIKKALVGKILCIGIPIVYYRLVAGNGEAKLKARIEKVDDALKSEFAPNYLDPDPIVDLNNDGVADLGSLQDAVHYSDEYEIKLAKLVSIWQVR